MDWDGLKAINVPKRFWLDCFNFYYSDTLFARQCDMFFKSSLLLQQKLVKEKRCGNYRELLLMFINHMMNVLSKGYTSLFIPKILWRNLEFVRIASRYNLYTLKDAPPIIQNNRQFVIDHIKKWGLAIADLNEIHRNDPEIISIALRQNSQLLQYAGEKCKANKDLALWCVANYWKNIDFVHPLLYDDVDFIIEAAYYNNEILTYASDRIKSNKDIMLTIIKFRPSASHIASHVLGSDPNFISRCSELIQSVDKMRKQEVWLLDQSDHIEPYIPFHPPPIELFTSN